MCSTPVTRAGVECGAAHDRGVELVASVGGEHRALAGVEQLVVLHRHDHGLDGLGGVVAAAQDVAARFERRREPGTVRTLLLGREVRAPDRPRAAVDGEHDVLDPVRRPAARASRSPPRPPSATLRRSQRRRRTRAPRECSQT
jgi:hypothetical protein